MTTKLNHGELIEQILADMKQGVMPWACPFAQGIFSKNLMTGKFYSGLNIFLLLAAARKFGFPTNDWATFNQLKQMGESVTKGARGVAAVFYKPLIEAVDSPEDTQEESMEELVRLVAKRFWLFNVSQTSLKEKVLSDFSFQPSDEVEKKALAIVEASGARIVEGSENGAFYSPSKDEIFMPSKDSFYGSRGSFSQSYFQTLFHELAHWTGHSSRLSREFGKNEKEEAYAFEELVAELTAALVSNFVGFSYERNSSDYLGHWIKMLSNDPKAFMRACGKAQRAFEFLTLKVGEDSEKIAS